MASKAKKRPAASAQSQAPDIDEDRNKDQAAGDSASDPAAEGNATLTGTNYPQPEVPAGDRQPDDTEDTEDQPDTGLDGSGQPILVNGGRQSLPEGAQSPKVDKALQEVRRVRQDAEDRLKFAGRTETEFVIHGIKDPDADPNAGTDDQDGPKLAIVTVGQRVYLRVNDQDDVVFDQHGWSQIVRAAQTAFQAVS